MESIKQVTIADPVVNCLVDALLSCSVRHVSQVSMFVYCALLNLSLFKYCKWKVLLTQNKCMKI